MAIFGKYKDIKNQINNPKFEKAFSYIQKLQDKSSKEYKSLENIKIGDCNKIVLDESCFVLEQAYILKDKKDCFFESHKKYIDIQYIFYGTEIMEVENINNLEIIQEYNESLDYAKHAQSINSSSLLIRENELAIFYPSDAHMPCLKVDKNEKIIKAVFKVAI
ncbi:YhcH/YjgK/YiaL family protein [Aliarcobacter butzleri]|uniref:YhcH/YjgK/YiaL family protein n=1 Tax=Aliarcobacter butzleri TaxID=28197 RepID=UPI0021B6D09B|nr:YhcH/YjgK/YiaL family protein [Aliarcobacter butzleri]MCT7579918.1 YhcH/YjgK/YiaL family protein [Aliarcobacter butzleri]MCT7593354.1 YhcH/YjgK/YiaL family protein [Aliarcobacter butzleri]